MLSRLLLTALALSSAVSSAPLPNQPKPVWLTTLENISGSPFGNGNNNGNDNGAGNNNIGNGNNNFGGNGNKNGNGNIFGNGNDVLSGNSGLKIGRNEQPTSSWSNFVTDYYKNIAGSPFNNGNGNGNGNTAGSGNQNNGNGNFGQNGNGNGNNNYFGNGNGILSGNNGIALGRKLLDSLNQDVSQLFTVVIPTTGPAIIKGALTGNPNILTPPGAGKQVQKRQVLTGLENIIAQAVSDEAPPNRSGFFGINI